jgi:hypothetical protein
MRTPAHRATLTRLTPLGVTTTTFSRVPMHI